MKTFLLAHMLLLIPRLVLKVKGDILVGSLYSYYAFKDTFFFIFSKTALSKDVLH